MENIVINGNLYKCKDGTNAKIKELLKKGEKAPSGMHESGTAFNEFNDFLYHIIDTQNGVFIENVYQTN